MKEKEIKGWRDVSLATARILDAIDGDLITQDVKIVSALLQLDEDEVWNKPLDRLKTSESGKRMSIHGVLFFVYGGTS